MSSRGCTYRGPSRIEPWGHGSAPVPASALAFGQAGSRGTGLRHGELPIVIEQGVRRDKTASPTRLGSIETGLHGGGDIRQGSPDSRVSYELADDITSSHPRVRIDSGAAYEASRSNDGPSWWVNGWRPTPTGENAPRWAGVVQLLLGRRLVVDVASRVLVPTRSVRRGG